MRWKESMIGGTISHYRIIGKLGEGWMGVVYKAEDMKLRPLFLSTVWGHLSPLERRALGPLIS